MEINSYIDHTLVTRDPKASDLDRVVNEAIKYKFKTVCVAPVWIQYIKDRLHKEGIEVTAVIGFPFGQFTTSAKVFEARDAIRRGADELDFVANISKIHDKDEKYLKRELKKLRRASKGKTIKLIIETGLLNDEEKRFITKLGVEANFDFIKTSTAIGTTGAQVSDIHLIKEITGNKAKIKASGGIRNLEAAQEMIRAGAERIGTSNGVAIVEGTAAVHEY